MQPDDLTALERLCDWSAWTPFAEAVDTAPREPGVYMAREGHSGPIVYVGMAGERRGHGIRGRLSVYASGKALASGLGEAVADRAFSDAAWLQLRLDEVTRGEPRRALEWGRAAFQRADLHVRWTVTADGQAARLLERECGAVCPDLWNRLAFVRRA
jgi:hypothetical protein